MSPYATTRRTVEQQWITYLCCFSALVTLYVLITFGALQNSRPVRTSSTSESRTYQNHSSEPGSALEKYQPVVVASIFGDTSFKHRFSQGHEQDNVQTPSVSLIPDSAVFPRVRRWNYDIQPYVDRATALLEGINTQCTWPTFHWDYEALSEDGYEIDYHEGHYHDTWDQFLETIGVEPRSQLIEWGCALALPNGQLNAEGEPQLDGGIATQLDLDAGIMIMMYTYRPMDAPSGIIINLSDIVYLAWQEMAAMFADGRKPLPKYFLVQGVANLETVNIVRSCIGTLANSFTVIIPPWPGRLWSINEPCGKALLGSPNGRGLGYMIAQHLEVPEGVGNAEDAIPFKGIGITGVRVFDVDGAELNLIFYLSQLQQPHRRHLTEVKPTVNKSSIHTLEILQYHPRPRQAYDYSHWLERGEQVLAAIRSHCAAQSPWTDPKSLEQGGYTELLGQSEADAGLWKAFLEQIGINEYQEFDQVVLKRTTDVDQYGREYFDGNYQFSFDLEKGLVMMSITYRAKNPGPNTIVNLSDILFLAWKRACVRYGVHGADINYYLVEDILNAHTQRTIEAACGGPGQPWPGKDFEIDSDCGKAILGCPSGVALGYLLSQHQNEFPNKEIGYVKIFDNTYGWPSLVFYLGPSWNLPQPPNEAHAEARPVQPVSKRDAVYDGSRNRGQRLIEAIKAQDTCPLPPTQYPDDAALAEAGYETGMQDYFATPPWDKFVRDVGGDVMTRFVRWRALRQVSAGPPVPDVYMPDGAFVQEVQVELGILIMVRTYQANEPAPNTMTHLSDIIFLGWQQVAKDRGIANPTIKYFCVDSIINLVTDRVVTQALVYRRTQGLTQYPGFTFSVDDADGGAAFYAILGTPSGRGIAWMIINHADALPRKTVSSVTAYDCSDGRGLLCLIFKVVDMDEAPAGIMKRLTIGSHSSGPLNETLDLGIAAPAA